MPAYLFDIKLYAAIRVTAPTEDDARAMLDQHLDAADCNAGTWPDGTPITFEASADRENSYDLIEDDEPDDSITIDGEEFEYLTLRSRPGGIDILGWDTYESSSVLAGQARKVFLHGIEGSDNNEAAARAWIAKALVDEGWGKEYADNYVAEVQFSNYWTEPRVSLAHLPGEDDPVSGGMYPDDCKD